MATERGQWEKRISELIVESKQHQTTYFEKIGNFGIYIHPTVYSPKYFPETLWYAEHLPPIVGGKSFLEVGVGSGLISVSVAASGSAVSGVDINPHAVETTKQNFEANGQSGTIVVSDVFDNVSGRFDFIFWNHPWQNDARIPEELKSEKTFDSGYRLLRRFIAQAQDHLTEEGAVLLGTSYYADLETMKGIYEENGYAHECICQGQRSIGKDVTEEYYIIQLRKQKTPHSS
ncbi:hypothetical protein BOTBODRAFT_37128 [Botryobasidium botryosum FD-172 SS1]|uniref:Methyltransferase small domain-containing protein n=1 Tax=Botryobasidium botryosum (strain FD-172 SS1) TaxID=930990 RepID=A0A067M3W3_BOTB1|nr:hypothetical protein BOTBODRAFT_37128 [Botryobasidium botryosum FD-172 SS1]